MLLNWQHLRRVATAAALALIVVWSAASLNRAGIWSDTINYLSAVTWSIRVSSAGKERGHCHPHSAAEWSRGGRPNALGRPKLNSDLHLATGAVDFPAKRCVDYSLGWVEAKMGDGQRRRYC